MQDERERSKLLLQKFVTTTFRVGSNVIRACPDISKTHWCPFLRMQAVVHMRSLNVYCMETVDTLYFFTTP